MERLKNVFVTKLSEENGSVIYRMNCTEKAATDLTQKEAVREIKKLCEKYNGTVMNPERLRRTRLVKVSDVKK